MPILAILGSGGWGTALATVLSQKPEHLVRLWSYRADCAEALRAQRENTQQLPGVRIPDSVEITASVEDATRNADAWITAIPTAYLRSTLKHFKAVAHPHIPAVSLTKGIEIETFRRPSEIIREELGLERTVVLSGPSHAEEVARGAPTSLVAACEDGALAAWVQRHFGSDRLRIYTNSDLIGVELAGALKNVLAIAAGICDGLKFGDNAKAALLTRGLVEMQRFGVAHGAEPATFHGLAGIGDLMTTCFSPHGRNRRVGERLAKGEPLAALMLGPQVAEGIFTAKSVYERLARAGLDAPILQGVYRVLYEGAFSARGGERSPRPPAERRIDMLTVAFKEWAVICESLARGRQSVILRKGGIHEEGGVFRPEHDRFWLYPTYFHEQQQAGIKPEAQALLDAAEAQRPPSGIVRLAHTVEVLSVDYCRELDELLKLDAEHIWSEATVRQRFAYRTPGLFVFRVKVLAAPVPFEIAERPEYAGCKTWVPLEPGDLQRV